MPNKPNDRPINTVVFDFGYTLVHLLPAREILCQDVLKNMGFEHDEKEIILAYHNVDSQLKQKATKIKNRRDKKIYFDEYNTLLAQMLRISSKTETFDENMQEYFKQKEHWVLYDDVVPTLDELRDVGIHMFILANWNSTLQYLCKCNDISKYFSGIFSSAQLGGEKPNPVIFNNFIDEANINPKNSLFVGDEYIADVVGPRLFGFRPVLLYRSQINIHGDCLIIDSLNKIVNFLKQKEVIWR